jgi:hypothetical protein
MNILTKRDFQGSRVTSDGGLIVIRDLDERLGLGDLITEHLTDARRGKNTQLPLVDLCQQSVYSRVVGYEDVNDAERPGTGSAAAGMNRRRLEGNVGGVADPWSKPAYAVDSTLGSASPH